MKSVWHLLILELISMSIKLLVLHSLQMSIKKNDYKEILKHDSFVDCSAIFIHSYIGLLKRIVSETETFLGTIDNSLRTDIVNMLNTSPKISSNKKKKYLSISIGSIGI